MAACNHVSPIEELENLFKIDLTPKDVSVIDKQEQRIGPDGYKIETFNEINSDCLSDKKLEMQQYDSAFVENRYNVQEDFLFPNL